MKIVYMRGNRTETLASLPTLRKLLRRFAGRRVFYELSSRRKAGGELYSVKNLIVVGAIEVTNRDVLAITICDANASAHGIEILNPALMRIYDDPASRFAVCFSGEPSDGVESRCYLRDEGTTETPMTQLDRLSLPQLFEYIDDFREPNCVGPVRPASAVAPVET